MGEYVSVVYDGIHVVEKYVMEFLKNTECPLLLEHLWSQLFTDALQVHFYLRFEVIIYVVVGVSADFVLAKEFHSETDVVD